MGYLHLLDSVVIPYDGSGSIRVHTLNAKGMETGRGEGVDLTGWNISRSCAPLLNRVNSNFIKLEVSLIRDGL